MTTLVRFFETLSIEDVPEVGGKNASLGEMIGALGQAGVRVPGGFATTAEAYRLFLAGSGADSDLERLLAGLDVRDVAELARRGRAARERILDAPFPPELEDAVRAAYRELGERCGETATDVAVRSSATAEDLPDASFAGQQETYLNVRGETALLQAVRRCFASLYTDRAIAYRASHGYAHEKVALSAGVQKMVRADLGAAGVIFTLDTETGFQDVVLISAAYGLGENVVRGVVTPDEFTVFKPTLAQGYRPILRRRLGDKALKMVYDRRGGTRTTRNLPVPADERARFSLGDDEVLQLARWAVAIEEHYSARAGEPRPMDLEWARDGRSGELYVLQARPETVQARRDRSVLETYRLEDSGAARGAVLAEGRAVGGRIGAGPVRRVRGPEEMADFAEGEVLVAEMTDPDWVPVMRKAAAIVTERGGRTCHAAIVSRELGVPAVVGATGALGALEEGADVTVCCAEGEVGRVYAGRLPFGVERVRLDEIPPRRTGVMVNAADPDRAFELAALPVDGIGLARMEFIITHSIRAHPLALLRWPDLADPEAVAEIEALTRGRADKAEHFVERLAEGVSCLAAAFWPRPVILRLSDFKTNEYAGLVGGAELEPHEENPMLGFRGASRYVHPRFREAFDLECAAIRRVRDEMGLRNLKLMVPFCRTPAEGEAVLEAMAQNGLARGQDGLEVYVMCELPANVVLARELGALFDGFSIGSNDLTQLVLGVDRDSELVAELFDERDEAVLRTLTAAIEGAHAAGRPIGICGQAPSDFPGYAEMLIDRGIDSISLNPDVALQMMLRVARHEARTDADAAGSGSAGTTSPATSL